MLYKLKSEVRNSLVQHSIMSIRLISFGRLHAADAVAVSGTNDIMIIPTIIFEFLTLGY